MRLRVMWGGKHLILLAAIAVLVKCQQKPTVSMVPMLSQVFTGDLFYLRCDGSESQSSVRWYFNNEEQAWTDKIWKILVAKPNNSGSYQCEANGQRSDELSVDVQELLPAASLTIKTGHPVMKRNSSVILELEHEDGLQGWSCRVCRGDKVKQISLNLRGASSDSVKFHPEKLYAPETIFWCRDKSGERRSNQVTLRISDSKVLLQFYPLPAVVGEKVILQCLADAHRISHAIFYRGDKVIADINGATYEISNITDSNEGSYKCHATFTYEARTRGPPYQDTSDAQDLLAAHPRAAVLSANMSCSCPLCPGRASYRYFRKNDQSWERLRSAQKPEESGTYRCQAVWRNSRSFPSRSVYVSTQPSIVSVVSIALVAVVVLGIAICCVAILMYKRSRATRAVYEDLPLRSPYETIQGARAKEDEYETLHPNEPVAGGKGGEYEALKAEGMKDGVYHTLSMAGASGGEKQRGASREKDAKAGKAADGGYEALKKEGMTEGLYHTLRMEGASGEQGGV